MAFDQERLSTRGRLADAEQTARSLEMRIHALADSIRQALPAFADPEEFEAEKASALAIELAGLHAEFVGLKQKILAMRRALGM